MASETGDLQGHLSREGYSSRCISISRLAVLFELESDASSPLYSSLAGVAET